MDYNDRRTPPPYHGFDSPANGYYSTHTHISTILQKVYLRMFIGLLISAFCALGIASSPSAIMFIYGNPIVYWGMFIAMIAMAWMIPSRLQRMKTGTCLLLFGIFSALMGCSLASIFLIYTTGTIFKTFFITAGVFGAMSVYGYFTKADLSKIGSYLMMALFGLIIASLVNIFLKSSGLEWAISLIGVVIFIGLTAWDTQQIKAMANANLSPELSDKLATMGAMNLYLDFINLFLFLLRIFGGSRD